MYQLVKALGHLVTYFICAITIDKIDVTESFFLSYFIISPIINEILWALSYSTCNKVVYQKLDINNSTAGSIGSTSFYIIYALILFVILLVLRKVGIIPFANDFDEELVNFITQYFNNLIMNFSNKIIEVLQATKQL